MTDTSTEAQVSIYERQVEDAALEAALESRYTLREERLALNKRFRESDVRAKTLLEGLELGEGAVVRVGRFLVTLRPVAPRSVSFDAEATSRLQISLMPE